MARVDVALEVGSKRVFAVAIEWPGWSRSGRSEEQALEALSAYAGRYAAAIDEPGLANGVGFDVSERLKGGGTTDFGAPGAAPAADDRPLDDDELERQVRLLQRAWAAFDAAAVGAGSQPLRTGPRGGGRDVPKMMEHVLGAEEAYLAQLGSRAPHGGASEPADPDVAMRGLRDAVLVTLRARARGEEPPNPRRTRSPWSPRYHVRRSAWHALDHAWEIEDRLIR